MTEGFSNPILGGGGVLIRSAVRSPNYVAGSSGWTINRDGSAEFNNGTFRGTVIISGSGAELLVYDGTPAQGNLIFSIASTAGSDSFGNNFPQGVCIYRTLTGDHPYNVNTRSGDGTIIALGGLGSSGGSLILQTASTNSRLQVGDSVCSLVNSNSGGAASLQTPLSLIGIQGDGTLLISVGGSNAFTLNVGGTTAIRANATGLEVGSGPYGQYLGREDSFSFAGIPNTVLTEIAGGHSIVKSMADYAGTISAGRFTAPIDSFYDTFLLINGVTSSTRTVAQIKYNGNPIASDEVPNSATVSTSVTGKWMAAGDTFSYWVFQSSGGSVTVTGSMTIGRRI